MDSTVQFFGEMSALKWGKLWSFLFLACSVHGQTAYLLHGFYLVTPVPAKGPGQGRAGQGKSTALTVKSTWLGQPLPPLCLGNCVSRKSIGRVNETQKSER